MTTRTVEVAEATQPMATYVEQTGAGPVVLTENGRPVAVMVSIENADLESVSLSLDPKFLAIIERSRARREREGGLSSDEIRRRFGLPKRESSKRTAVTKKGKRTKPKARSTHARR